MAAGPQEADLKGRIEQLEDRIRNFRWLMRRQVFLSPFWYGPRSMRALFVREGLA